MWMTTCYACKTRPHPKTIAPNPDAHINSYIPQSESPVIHPKILTRKSESVLIHSEKISQITVLSHSYIIDNCKTTAGISKTGAEYVKQNRPSAELEFGLAVKMHKSENTVLCNQPKRV